MWALVGNNVAVLTAFLRCNLEDIDSSRRADAQHPKIFSGILVCCYLRSKTFHQCPSCQLHIDWRCFCTATWRTSTALVAPTRSTSKS